MIDIYSLPRITPPHMPESVQQAIDLIEAAHTIGAVIEIPGHWLRFGNYFTAIIGGDYWSTTLEDDGIDSDGYRITVVTELFYRTSWVDGPDEDQCLICDCCHGSHAPWCDSQSPQVREVSEAEFYSGQNWG